MSKSHYQYYADFCRCVGHRCYLGVQDFSGQEPSSYPLMVFNLGSEFIGVAQNKQQYVDLWNGDPMNQLYGSLMADRGPFNFILVKNVDIVCPPHLIGIMELEKQGIYAIQYEEVYE